MTYSNNPGASGYQPGLPNLDLNYGDAWEAVDTVSGISESMGGASLPNVASFPLDYMAEYAKTNPNWGEAQRRNI